MFWARPRHKGRQEFQQHRTQIGDVPDRVPNAALTSARAQDDDGSKDCGTGKFDDRQGSAGLGRCVSRRPAAVHGHLDRVRYAADRGHHHRHHRRHHRRRDFGFAPAGERSGGGPCRSLPAARQSVRHRDARRLRAVRRSHSVRCRRLEARPVVPRRFPGRHSRHARRHRRADFRGSVPRHARRQAHRHRHSKPARHSRRHRGCHPLGRFAPDGGRGRRADDCQHLCLERAGAQAASRHSSAPGRRPRRHDGRMGLQACRHQVRQRSRQHLDDGDLARPPTGS